MKLEDLPDDFTPEQFMQLDKEALDQLPYTIIKWNCQCKKCNRGSTIRDYGLAPWYFENRNSKAAAKNPAKYWVKIANTLQQWEDGCSYLFCGKHWMMRKKLMLHFDRDHVMEKIVDRQKSCIDHKIIKSSNQGIQKVESYGQR